MTKTKKNLYIIAIIFAALSAISFVVTLVSFIQFKSLEIDQVVELINEMSNLPIPQDIVEVLMSMIDTLIVVISVILVYNLAVVIIVFNLLFTNQIGYVKFKPLIIVLTVLAILTTNLLLFAILLAALLTKEEWPVQENNESSESKITQQLESIRKLYETGAINKTEYDILVRDLFNKIDQ